MYQTNAGRKRRRTDPETPSFDSEENVRNKVRTAKDIESTSFDSHGDCFPKGKRKARKRRRRLALQGRGIKDVVVTGKRYKERGDFSYDEDIGSLSDPSSEESLFSEDEMTERGTCPLAGQRDVSASS